METLHFLTCIFWGFLSTSPLCFPIAGGVGALLCTLLLEFEDVSEHAVSQVGPGVGLLGARSAGGEVGWSGQDLASLAGRCERVSLRQRGVNVAYRG